MGYGHDQVGQDVTTKPPGLTSGAGPDQAGHDQARGLDQRSGSGQVRSGHEVRPAGSGPARPARPARAAKEPVDG